MTSWMKERDLLVEQTMAFVKGVAASKPISVKPVPFTEPQQVEASETADDLPPTVQAALLTATLAARSDRSEPAAAKPSAEPIFVAPALEKTAKPLVLPEQSERDLIAQRVATFRASQRALHAKRAAAYDSLRDKLRASLDNR